MAHSLPELPAEGDMMTSKLVVLKPFASFKRGDMITDAAEIATVLASEHALSVVRVTETAGS
jgi:hypothetical protein